MKNLFNNKFITLCSAFLVIAFLSPITFGQNKKELHKKLDKIDGKVKKISIQTDKGTVSFTGKEAEEILKKLKKKENKFVFSVDRDDVFDKHHDVMFFSDDDNIFDVDKDGLSKKVKVEIINGKKEATIETTKDGKKTVEKLKGKEAEEYLKKNKVRSKTFSWKDKDGKKIKMKRFKVKSGNNVWFDKDDGDVIILKNKKKKHFKHNDSVEKEIKINVKNGKKEVTVTTTKDGKKIVKTYKDKDDEKYLEKLEHDDDITVDIKDKDNMKKIIIKKKDKKTDKN